MVDKLGLTFGLLISFFFPGFVVFLAFVVRYYAEITVFCERSPTFSGAAVAVAVVLSVIAGLVLDAVRYFLLHLLKKLFKKVSSSFRELHNFTMKDANEDDIKYHDWVIENHFRFHQFYGNLFLGVVCAVALLNDFINGFLVWNGVWILIFIIGGSACLAYRATVKKLKARFGDNGKKEESMI